MTDVAVVIRPPGLARVAAGAGTGLLLGVLARAWMRLIAEDPAFTWSGSLFIVLGFTLFGTTHGLALVARRRRWRPAAVQATRGLALLGTMPLFLAAGAQMAPTVVFGALALGRTTWPVVVRGLLAVLAGVPAVLVAADLVDTFRWSVRTVAGVVGLVALYAVLVRTAGPTTTAATERRLPAAARVAVAALAAVGLGVPLPLGGLV